MTRGVRVLVVDDEPNAAESVRAVLRRVGHAVTTVHDGHGAVEMVRSHHFDVVLMDVRMPGIDGMEALRLMRTLQEPPRVVLMSATTAPTLLEEARAAGADEVFAKPLDMPKLIAMINGSPARTSVLVVDDDPEFVASVARSLRGNGLAVRTARSADEALRQLDAPSRVDVVLLDHRLPGQSGAEAAQTIRAKNLAPTVVLMSAFALDGLDRDGLSAVLHKPFDVAELLETIVRATAA